jgi:hypothetical protein
MDSASSAHHHGLCGIATVQLIMQDLKLDFDTATRVLDNSREFGTASYTGADDSDKWVERACAAERPFLRTQDLCLPHKHVLPRPLTKVFTPSSSQPVKVWVKPKPENIQLLHDVNDVIEISDSDEE